VVRRATYTAQQTNNPALMSRCPRYPRTTTVLPVLTVERLDAILDTTQLTEMRPNRTEKLRSPLIAARSVARALTSRRASASDSSKRFPIHSRQKLPSTTATGTSAIHVALRLLLLTPNCPAEGQFGVNVIAQATLSKYE